MYGRADRHDIFYKSAAESLLVCVVGCWRGYNKVEKTGWDQQTKRKKMAVRLKLNTKAIAEER